MMQTTHIIPLMPNASAQRRVALNASSGALCWAIVYELRSCVICGKGAAGIGMRCTRGGGHVMQGGGAVGYRTGVRGANEARKFLFKFGNFRSLGDPAGEDDAADCVCFRFAQTRFCYWNHLSER